MAGWAHLSPGNLLRVFWEGENDSHVCKLVEDDDGQLFVRSADNRFRELVPFSASEDSWIKLRQTCHKDNVLSSCPNCSTAGSGKARRCLCKSGECSPPGWMPVVSADHRELLHSDTSESDEDPVEVSRSGRRLCQPKRCVCTHVCVGISLL